MSPKSSKRPRKKARVDSPEAASDQSNEATNVLDPKVAKKGGTYMDRLVTVFTETAKISKEANEIYLEKKRKPVLEEDLDELLGPMEPEYDKWWSKDDERALIQEWKQSKERQDFKRITTSSNSKNEKVVRTTAINALQGLWKISIRLFRCSPFAILSPRRNLVYQPLPSKRQGSVKTTLWSQEFCENLGHLMANPLWCGSADLLAIILQFAVICRTDDRRPWKFEADLVDSRVLLNLRRKMDQVDGDTLPQSVHDMHTAIRRSLKAKGMVPSVISDLLHRIGSTSEGNVEYQASNTLQYGVDVYFVTKADVEKVQAALDTVSPMGQALLQPGAAYYYNHLLSRQGTGTPESYEELKDLLIRCWLHEKRVLGRLRARRGDLDLDEQDSQSGLHSSGSREDPLSKRGNTQPRWCPIDGGERHPDQAECKELRDSQSNLAAEDLVNRAPGG